MEEEFVGHCGKVNFTALNRTNKMEEEFVGHCGKVNFAALNRTTKMGGRICRSLR